MNEPALDFSPEVIEYLKKHKGNPIPMMQLINDLTTRIHDKPTRNKFRGKILSALAKLIRHKKVIRSRKVKGIGDKPRSSQGTIRISEVYF